jgi:hypothetical protein
VDLGRSESVNDPACVLSPTSTETTTTESLSPKSTPTLTEIVEWKNRHGIRFVRGSGGRVWVTNENEPLLTPAIATWIADNQDVVAMFVPDNETLTDAEFWTQAFSSTSTTTEAELPTIPNDCSPETFYEMLRTMNA